MDIKVLGSGCAKCKKLTENAEKAVSESGVAAQVVKVTDMQEIMKHGVMSTPALVVDGKVKSTGKVLTVGEIKELLK